MKDKIKLSIFWIFSFLVITFLMTFSSHASSPNSLPYIVVNENINGYDDFWNTASIYQPWEDVGYFYNRKINGDDFFGYDYFENGYHFFAIYFPNENFDYSFTLSEDYSDFDMTIDSCQMTFNNVSYIKGRFDGLYFYGSLVTWNDSTTQNVRFFVGSNKGDGNTLVPNISTSNYVYDDNEYQVVFGFGNPTPPYTGHATAPEEFDSPVYPTGHAKPNQVPSGPTINNYSWTTHNNPPIDTTNLESLVESLIYIVIYNFSYLFTNLAGLFNNLISNISSLISYIGQLIEYYGNLIISNIQNAINTFYNNMVSLFDPVLDGITYLVEPLDQDIIYDNISSTSLVTNITTVQTSLTSFQASFNGVSEPSSYTIPIHLENLPSNWFGNQTTQYIDLGIINGTVKDGLRLFVWAMVTYSLVVTIFDSIANYINGGGDES